MASWSRSPNTNATAPAFAVSDTALATRTCRLGVAVGWKYSAYTLRTNEVAAAIDITAAGTSAPTVIAPKTRPASGAGISRSTSMGTAASAPPSGARTPGGERRDAEEPEEGEHAPSRRAAPPTTLRRARGPSAAKPAVRTCGYISRASAEPSASVAKAGCWSGLSDERRRCRRPCRRAGGRPRRRPRPGPPSLVQDQPADGGERARRPPPPLSAEITVGARSPCR